MGIPISRSVQIPAGRAFDPVRHALEAIDAVHGDGVLPPLPVIRTRGRVQVGAYVWNSHTGEALRLSFSATNDHAELSVIHEIGHFLDHQALGRPGIFASESGALGSLMQVISATDAATRLRSLRSRRRFLFEERGRRLAETINHSRVEYLLQPRELFARAYAQFIAEESRNPVLMRQLEAVRSTRQSRVYHDLWADDDFSSVGTELRSLIGRRRWMTSR